MLPLRLGIVERACGCALLKEGGKQRDGCDTLVSMRALALAVLIALPGAMPGRAQHEDDTKDKERNPAIGDPKAIAAGQVLFRNSCAGCHGPNGDGGRGPNLRKRISWGPLTDDIMFNLIQKGVPGADMPPTKIPDEQVWQVVAFVRALTSPAFEVGVLGDAEAGKAIFWGAGGCSNCHAIGGRGGLIGPDLTNIGAMRSADQLRESIVAPDEEGVFAFQPAAIVFRDGRRIEGVVRNRSNYSLQLVDRQGRVHMIQTANVEAITLSKKSLMPGDYGKKLSREQIRDLVAYLAQQSVRPKEIKKSESNKAE
jgi:putative heme-binding domain-containing protein